MTHSNTLAESKAIFQALASYTLRVDTSKITDIPLMKNKSRKYTSRKQGHIPDSGKLPTKSGYFKDNWCLSYEKQKQEMRHQKARPYSRLW